MGNQAANHFLSTVGGALDKCCTIRRAAGQGYPDLIFAIGGNGHCLEMKATSKWDENGTNRCVLTSSPLKIRKLIDKKELMNPPAHVLCVLVYDLNSLKIESVRMEFLDPESIVNIRLEASTSGKLLSTGEHPKFSIT